MELRWRSQQEPSIEYADESDGDDEPCHFCGCTSCGDFRLMHNGRPIIGVCDECVESALDAGEVERI